MYLCNVRWADRLTGWLELVSDCESQSVYSWLAHHVDAPVNAIVIVEAY